MWYAIDRFEDDQAVLQDDLGNTLVVDKSLLPLDAKQGDVLNKSDGHFIHDREETMSRRDRVYRLEQMLRGK